MKTSHKKQKELPPPNTEKDMLTSSKALRLVLENIWLLGLPILGAVYVGIVGLMNSSQLRGVPFLRILQALCAALIVFILFTAVGRIFRSAFQRAKKDLELLFHAKTLAKKAKSSLSKLSAEKKHHVRVALNTLKQAMRSGVGIQAADHSIESLLSAEIKPSKAGVADYFGSLFIALLVALFLRGFLVGNFVIPSGSMIPTLQVGDHIFVNQLIYGLGIPFTTYKFGMHLREPKPGEIIVFSDVSGRDRDLIKRVIAIPHDTITFCRDSDTIQINGQDLPQQDDPQACVFVDKNNPETDDIADWYYVDSCRLITETNRGKSYHIQKTRISGNLAEGDAMPTFVASDFHEMKDRPGCYSYEVPIDHVFVMGDNRDHSMDARYFGSVPYERIKGKAMRIWWSDGVQFIDGKAQPYARLDRIFQEIK